LSSPGCIGTGLDQDDIHGLYLVLDLFQFILDILYCDSFTVRLMPEIQHNPIVKTPVKGNFVNGQSPPTFIHGGMIVIRGIQVSAGVGRKRQKFHRPSQSSGELLFFDSREKVFHLLGSHFVIDIVNFGNHHGRITGQIGFDTDAQVNKTLA